MTFPKRSLGANGPAVPLLGLGCMRLSNSADQEARSVAIIQAALDSGISVLNTGDFYGMGDSELVIGKAVRGRRDKAFICVKYGGQMDPAGKLLGFNAGYAATLSSLAYTLRRLGTDYIDLYQPARIFPNVPLEETMEALTEAVRRGYVRYLGLSEVSPQTIERASAIHPITAIEMEYSVAARDAETAVFPAARAAGAGLVAYAVLAAGLLGGRPSSLEEHRGRPRFEEQNLETNLVLSERLRAVADGLGVTAAQLAIAWVLARGEDIIPLIAPRDRADLDDALGALEVRLGPVEMAAIDEVCPPGSFAGTYHAEAIRNTVVPEPRR